MVFKFSAAVVKRRMFSCSPSEVYRFENVHWSWKEEEAQYQNLESNISVVDAISPTH